MALDADGDVPAAGPRPIAHIGLTVPDLGAAVEWYRKVLGFGLSVPAVTLRPGLGYAGDLAEVVFGDGFVEAQVAQLATGSSVPLELFEFRSPRLSATPPFEYWRTGWCHICVVDPQPEALCGLIERNGGRQLTGVLTIVPGQPYRMAYCKDPFGIVVEVYSHTQAEVVDGVGKRRGGGAQ